MNVLANMLKQQAIGVINLSIPLILLFLIYPAALGTTVGLIMSALVMGVYVFYLNWKATKNQAAALQYSPTGARKEQFEQMIKECKLDPQGLILRYGYCHEGVAMAMFNTISVDPLVCAGVEDDPQALAVKNILLEHQVPLMSVPQKIRIQKVHEICSPAVQRFIFKHELGHVFYNYSNKKLILVGFIFALAVFGGMAAAFAVAAWGVWAVFFGMLVGGLIDLFLSYSSNLFFKYFAEKNADLFAARFSSLADREAAADFFEKHQIIVETYPEANVLAKVPGVILSGHPSGKARARYLRQFCLTKKV